MEEQPLIPQTPRSNKRDCNGSTKHLMTALLVLTNILVYIWFRESYLSFSCCAMISTKLPSLLPAHCQGFRLANYYGDGMVLQRGPQGAVVWGFGPKGSLVDAFLSDSERLQATTVNGKC